MTKDEFNDLKQKVNKLALEYAQNGKSIRLREQIWLSLWKMRNKLFGAESICSYRKLALSGLYDAEEFLEEVLKLSIPEILDDYAKAEFFHNYTFMQYFDKCFLRKIRDTYRDIQDKIPYDYIVVQKPTIHVYKDSKEDAVIPGKFLKQGMKRRILEKKPDGAQTWIKTQMKEHGKTVYVREEDVDYHKVSLVNLDDENNNVEPAASGQIDEQIICSEIYEDYIMTLLSLIEQLYSRNQLQKPKGLSKQYCFKLLYTETVIDKLKQIYDVIDDVKTAHEQEVLSVAEIDLMDYLLKSTCRTFISIVKTPLRAYRDFAYLNIDNTEEIPFPIANIIYAHFLVDIKGIDRKLDTLAPSLSKYRTEFNQLYSSIVKRDKMN